jgi:hypothetical protein
MREGRRHVKNGRYAPGMNKFGAKLPEIDAIFRQSPKKTSILTMFFSSYQ